MSNINTGEILFNYFRKFVEWLKSHDDNDIIDVFHVNDDMVSQLLGMFFSNYSIKKTDSSGKYLPPLPKHYKKFKAAIVLDDGNKTAKFDLEYKILYVTENGSKRFLMTDKMADIYKKIKDDNGNLDDCIELAKKEFIK